MKDVDIEIKQPDGTVLVVNTDMIEEDVLRSMCGLEPKEQDWKGEWKHEQYEKKIFNKEISYGREIY